MASWPTEHVFHTAYSSFPPGRLQGIPLKDKGQTDSYQRIEAPVRGGEQAPGKIPDGGPPVTERQNDLDRLLIQNDQAQVSIIDLRLACDCSAA